MTEALIFGGVLIQTAAKTFPVHPTLIWVNINGIIPVPEVGWTYADGIFSPPPGPTLAALKRLKGQEFISEAVSRIAVQVPDWDTLDKIKLIAGLWPAISATVTPAQLQAKDLYVYVRDIVTSKLAAVTTKVELAGIDPAAADPFGDGTPWPV